MAASWANFSDNTLPAKCTASSFIGKYTPPCATAVLVTVTFNVLVATQYGENVYISGSTSELGDWDTNLAIALSAECYTAENPIWHATVTLPAGFEVQYKFIKRERNGSMVWEIGNNREYTIPVGCTGKAIKRDAWR